MSYCKNCGTKLSDGTCSWCQLELYIYENQCDDLPEDFEFSEEFGKELDKQIKEKYG